MTPPRPSPPALPRLLAAAFACLAAAASPCLRASFPDPGPVLAEFGGTYDGVGNPISISKSAESGGTKLDGQRANCEEEHPTGLFREHFRYRDPEAGVWLSRDPAGFVDGSNLYANNPDHYE